MQRRRGEAAPPLRGETPPQRPPGMLPIGLLPQPIPACMSHPGPAMSNGGPAAAGMMTGGVRAPGFLQGMPMMMSSRPPCFAPPVDPVDHKAWNSDDEEIDEFGRQKRKRKAAERSAAAVSSRPAKAKARDEQPGGDDDRKKAKQSGGLSAKQKAALERLHGRCKKPLPTDASSQPAVDDGRPLLPPREESHGTETADAPNSTQNGMAAVAEAARPSMVAGCLRPPVAAGAARPWMPCASGPCEQAMATASAMRSCWPGMGGTCPQQSAVRAGGASCGGSSWSGASGDVGASWSGMGGGACAHPAAAAMSRASWTDASGTCYPQPANMQQTQHCSPEWLQQHSGQALSPEEQAAAFMASMAEAFFGNCGACSGASAEVAEHLHGR